MLCILFTDHIRSFRECRFIWKGTEGVDPEVGFLHLWVCNFTLPFCTKTMYFSLRVSPNHNRAKKRFLLNCLCHCCVGHTCILKCPALLLGSPPKPVTCRLWMLQGCSDTRELLIDISQVFPTVKNSLNLSFSLQSCGGWQLNRLREASYLLLCNA